MGQSNPKIEPPVTAWWLACLVIFVSTALCVCVCACVCVCMCVCMCACACLHVVYLQVDHMSRHMFHLWQANLPAVTMSRLCAPQCMSAEQLGWAVINTR
jgi:hypothetical protein